MKPDQLNHLKLIDAHLDKLLALAAKRTAGAWAHQEYDSAGESTAVVSHGFSDGLGKTVALSPHYGNFSKDGAFIAACAGNAEAGWVATKGMVMLIFKYEELAKTTTTPLTLEAVDIARDSILESILIAWPLTRVTPRPPSPKKSPSTPKKETETIPPPS